MSEKFKYCSGTRVQLGEKTELFRSQVTREWRMVPKATAALAAACSEFATLHEHQRRLESIVPKLAGNPEAVSRILADAVEHRMLLSLSGFRRRFLDLLTASQQHHIGMIGIPTRNRPKTLRTLLQGLVANLELFGRKVELLIVDDSETPEMQQENLRVLESFSSSPGVTARYANGEDRREFAYSLAEESGVNPELALFALTNVYGYPVSVGAARNAILFASAGECVLYLDDDVQCRWAVVPGSTDGFQFDPNAFNGRFFADAADVELCHFVHEDLLKLHERLLNVSRWSLEDSTAAANEVDFSGLSSGLLQHMSSGNSMVLASFLGLLGDAAIDDPLQYFVQGPETLAALTSSEELYRNALKNRMILRGARSYLITKELECMSYCMALNHKDLLPPFLPVQRAEEMVFGSLLMRCVPGALFGVAPRAILHRPQPARSFAPEAAFDRAGKFTLGELINVLITTASVHGVSRRDRLLSAGEQLKSIARLDDDDLAERLRKCMEPSLVFQIQQLELALQKLHPVPEFLANDTLRLRDGCLSALNQRDCTVPYDFERLWLPQECRVRFRQLIGRFASLLEEWPALMDAANSLRARGVQLFNPVETGRCHAHTR
jgi:hypothetical protein